MINHAITNHSQPSVPSHFPTTSPPLPNRCLLRVAAAAAVSSPGASGRSVGARHSALGDATAAATAAGVAEGGIGGGDVAGGVERQGWLIMVVSFNDG